MNVIVSGNALPALVLRSGPSSGAPDIWPPDEEDPAPATTVGVISGDSTFANYLGGTAVGALISGFTETDIAVAGETITQQQAHFDALSDYSTFKVVVLQPGLNSIAGTGTSAAAIAALKAYVADVRTKVPASCKIILSQLVPCARRWYDLYGLAGGAVAYQQWQEINAAIAASGSWPSPTDAQVTSHVAAMGETQSLTYESSTFSQANCLKAIYEAAADHIHPNTAGRQINADAIRAAMVSLGLIAPVGVTLQSLALSASSFTVGTATSGTITGATATSTIVATSAPTGFTINSAARTWAYDGTGSASTGSLTLTETLAGATGSPKATVIGYTVAATPAVFTTMAALFASSELGGYYDFTDGTKLAVNPDGTGGTPAVEGATRWAIDLSPNVNHLRNTINSATRKSDGIYTDGTNYGLFSFPASVSAGALGTWESLAPPYEMIVSMKQASYSALNARLIANHSETVAICQGPTSGHIFPASGASGSDLNPGIGTFATYSILFKSAQALHALASDALVDTGITASGNMDGLFLGSNYGGAFPTQVTFKRLLIINRELSASERAGVVAWASA